MKPTVHYLPIEPIPARYTEQMLAWVSADLAELERSNSIAGYRIYTPNAVDTSVISSGQFWTIMLAYSISKLNCLWCCQLCSKAKYQVAILYW